ncbi:MAG: amidophosphoribosyltransferase, partial [Pseudomonadota bacterium]
MKYSDKPKEECAIVAISTSGKVAAQLSILGLHALQHRGQEAAGLVVYNGKSFSARRGQGLVSEVFKNIYTSNSLPGNAAIAHSRYSTTG